MKRRDWTLLAIAMAVSGAVVLLFLLFPGSLLILCSVNESGSWAVFWPLAGLAAVAFVALVTNIGGIRGRLPLLNSSSKLVRATGWIWLAIAAILAVAYPAGGLGSCSSPM